MSDEQDRGDGAAAQPEQQPERFGDAFAGPDWRNSARRRVRTSPDQVRRRVHGRRRKRTRRLLLGVGVFAVLLVAAVAWLAYTASRARSELELARAEVHSLRSEVATGDFSAARETARTLQAHAHRAHDLTTGPIWAGAAAVPFFGDPLDTARVVSASVDSIASDALPALIDASSSLDPHSLRRPDGSFDLAPISKVAPVLGRSVSIMQAAVGKLSGSSGSTWIGSVNSARDDLLAQLNPLIGTLHDADVAANTVPELLGQNGPKRYLVSFLNQAEIRGLGGLPGAFAILQADHGKLTFQRFESDNTLVGTHANVDLGTDYDRTYHYVGDALTLYQDTDFSPHFPYAAKAWLGMWHTKTGQQLDGALTLDPTAISYLLQVAGPARLPDGTIVDANNVVALTQKTAYAKYGALTPKAVNARKAYLLDIARAVSKVLVSPTVDPTGLVRAAARAAGENRLLVWSADQTVENRLATTPIAGVVPAGAAPYFALALNNMGATKLDYYLSADVDWTRTGCGPTRDVTVTVKLHNGSPGGLPQYVYGLTGNGFKPSVRGTNRTDVNILASTGASLKSMTINGKPAGAISGIDHGHPMLGTIVDVPAGATWTIVYHLQEPAGHGALVSRIQPMIKPARFTASDQSCS